MKMQDHDHYWMSQALRLAKQALQEGEVPIGAVVVRNNVWVASGWNQPIRALDPTAHAEIVALRQAATVMQNYRLVDTTLYVTLEPCAMCMAAIKHARVARLVFGAPMEKGLTHPVSCQGGVLQAECREILKTFFQERRCSVSDK